MKTKMLIAAMGLSLSVNAFAFFNEGAVTGSDSVAPAEQSMQAPVEQPVQAPVEQEMVSQEPVIDQAAIARQLEQEARQKEIDQAAIARKLEEEARKAELEAKRKAQAEARAKAEKERQARLAAQRAEREAEERDRKELVRMRNEGIQKLVGSLNLVEMPDRLKFKAHYDRMVELADGDKQNKHIKDFGIVGARAYYNDALDHVQEQGQYLFESSAQGKEWGFALKTGITQGEYVEIMKTFPIRVETGLTMIDLAEKYANHKNDIHEFVQFRKYLNWRQENMQTLLDHAEKLQADPEYDPNKKMNGLNLADVGKVVLGKTVEIGGAAVDKTKEVGGKIWGGVKGLFD